MFVSEEARRLFDEALTLSPDQRESFITAACAGDLGLLNEVSSLLGATDGSAAYFGELADRISLSALADNDDSAQQGKVAGNWRLGECIGRGGMGSVYLAERADEEFEKQVAVKLLPVGMDGDVARARFTQERQILAQLVHDNIARLLDGGVTDDGVPFFVMDFVDGIAIDDYCNENKLDVAARLRLMLDVCDAVQYAHSNLVVHRDLKPGNVLVAKEGLVRLLDFGVARVLEPTSHSSDATHYAQRPVTPAFASPEMLRGDPVDVTTDVYSIGVMLYLLLTDHIPISFDGLGAADAMQHAASAVPLRVDSIDSCLDADLAAVVAKALAKLPEERYSTVDRLAADIRNYLAGRPVDAKAPTVGYRLAKFVRRHRLPLAAATSAVVALVALTIVAVLQSNEAARQRDLAVLDQQRLQAGNEFYSLLLEEMGDRPFNTVELLDRGRAMLEQQFGLDRPFMGRILYDVSRNYARLDEADKQRELLLQSETLATENGDNNLLAMVSCRLAAVYARSDTELASQYVAKGRALYDGLANPGIDATLDCLRMYAREAERSGDYDTSLAYLERAKAALDAYPTQAVNLRGPLLNHISGVYLSTQQFEKSSALLDEIIALLESSGRGNSLGYIRVVSNKAEALSSAGNFEESLATWARLVEQLRASGYEQRGSAGVLSRYARTLQRSGRMAEAKAIHLETIQAAEAAGDEVNLAAGRLGLATFQVANKDYAGAHESLDAAQAYLLQNESNNLVLAGFTKVQRIKAYRGERRFDVAIREVEKELAEIGYPAVKKSIMLISYLIEAGAVHQAAGNFVRAEEYATDVIGKMKERATGNPMENIDVARSYVHRAEIRASLEKRELAIADLELSVPVLIRVFGEEHRESKGARALLASLTGDQGETRRD